MKRILFLICMTFTLFGSVQAAKPEYFISRGRVVDANLKAVPGTYEIRASFWKTANAPEENLNQWTLKNALWIEHHIIQLQEDGRFEIRIGSEKKLPKKFTFNKYSYLQLEIRKGQEEYQILDPRALHQEIDRIMLVTLPYKLVKGKVGKIIDETSDTIISIGTTTGDIPVLNQNGELDASVIPINIKSSLNSLQTDVEKTHDHAKGNTQEIDSLRKDITDIEEGWETKWNTTFTEENTKTVSLLTNLTSQAGIMEQDIKKLKRREQTLRHKVNQLPDLVDKAVNELAEDTFVTKEELKDLELKGLDSAWKDVLHAGTELASNEDSSIGDIQFIVDEKKLAAFDGNTWNRLADQKDLEASIEKTVQKTFYYHDEIVDINQKKIAQPGLFYWDKDKSTYFIGMADGSMRSLFASAALPAGVEENGRNEAPVADWIDFRNVNLNTMVIQASKNTMIKQDGVYGIKIRSSKQRSNSSIAFPDAQFTSKDTKTYEAVFYTGNMSGQILLGLMDGDTPPPSKNLGESLNTEIGLYMYLQEDSDLFYGHSDKGASSYEIFERTTEWKRNTYYRLSIKVPNSEELSSLVTIVEVSADDFNTPIKTIVNHESYFDGLSDSLKPYLFGSGKIGYSLVAFRTY